MYWVLFVGKKSRRIDTVDVQNLWIAFVFKILRFSHNSVTHRFQISLIGRMVSIWLRYAFLSMWMVTGNKSKTCFIEIFEKPRPNSCTLNQSKCHAAIEMIVLPPQIMVYNKNYNILQRKCKDWCLNINILKPRS